MGSLASAIGSKLGVHHEAPQTELACPLCMGFNMALIERIKARHLVAMANKMLESDISSEFEDISEIRFYRCNDCDLQFFSPLVTGSKEFYRRMQRFNWYYKQNKEEYEFARGFVHPCDSVLEIGSGRGVFAKKIPAVNYVGLEFSPDAVRLACQEGVHVINELIQDHSISNQGKYNIVCAFQVLEHVANTRSFIEASLACLAPGGLLVYSVPSADSFLAVGTNAVTNLPPHHVTRWSDTCLRNLALTFRLKLVALEHEKLGHEHKRIYASVVLLVGFERLLGIEPRVVNRTFRHRVLAKVANAGARILEKGLCVQGILPHGPSVTAVYQKI